MSHAIQAPDVPAPGSVGAANAPGRVHPRYALRAALVGAVAVVGILLAFIWPSATTTTKHLPVVLIGSPAQEQRVQDKASANDAGFDVTRVDTREQAEQLLKERKAYGAFVYSGESTLEVLTASAASPAAAQLIGRVVQGLGQDAQKSYITSQQAKAQNAATLAAQAAGQAGAAKSLAGVVQQMQATVPPESPQLQALAAQAAQQQKAAEDAAAKAKAAKAAASSTTAPSVTVTDVAPLASSDPRGSSLATVGLPLTLGGMLGGSAIALMIRGTRSRLVGVVLYGVLGGLAIVLIMHTWLGVLQGHWGLEWLTAGLSLGATAALIVGLQALIGQLGVLLGSGINMVIANPMSSLSFPKEYLPKPWGDVGQMFIPGSTGTLLRDLSYFPEASVGQQWAVLVVWLVMGMGLSLVAAGVRRGW